jgi:Cu/Ag efflux pump CusA
MTSLTTIFGLVPLAVGFGPGAQMQQPLAIAVIGGLIANMLPTRLLIPVGYLVLSDRSKTVVASWARIIMLPTDHPQRMSPTSTLTCC